MAIRDEQETTVTGNRKEGVYLVWSSDPVHMRKFDKAVEDGRVEVVRRWDDAAEYRVPAEFYDPARGLKRKSTLSPEDRARRAERMRNIQNH